MVTTKQRQIILRERERGLTGSEIQKVLRKETGKGIRRAILFDIIRRRERSEEEKLIKRLKHTPIKHLSKEDKQAKDNILELLKEAKQLEKETKKEEAIVKYKEVKDILGSYKLEFKWDKWSKRKGWWLYYEVWDYNIKQWKVQSRYIHAAKRKPSVKTFNGLKNNYRGRIKTETRNYKLKWNG